MESALLPGTASGSNASRSLLRNRKPYKYTALSEGEIRLFRISAEPESFELRLTMRHHRLDSALPPRYIALSYCWGSESAPRTVNIDDENLIVTENILAVLNFFMSHSREFDSFWADQICIDQDNMMERNEQVHHMWRIYSEASLVYAWLGCYNQVKASFGERSDAVEHSTVPKRPLLKEPSCYRSWDHEVSALSAGDHHILKLLEQPYFTRTWIIPEILQARQLTFLDGDDAYPADTFRNALSRLVRIGHKENVHMLIKVKQMLDRRSRTQLISTLEHKMTERATFLSSLELLHGTNCSVLSDKIFAALTCPTITTEQRVLALRPDYSLTRDELVVVSIAYYEQLQPHDENRSLKELSRTLVKSLTFNNEMHTTSTCMIMIAASVLCCTRSWAQGDSLYLQSGTNVGLPGRFIRHLLLTPLHEDLAAVVASTRTVSQVNDDVWANLSAVMGEKEYRYPVRVTV